MLIAVEGPDGAGKTTLCNRLHRGLTSYGKTCRVIRSPYDFVDVGCVVSEIIKTHNMKKITVMLLFCWYFNQIAEKVRLVHNDNDYVFLDRYSMSNYMYNCIIHNEHFENVDGFAFNYSKENKKTVNMIKRLQDKSVNVLGKAICALAIIAESVIFYDIVRILRPFTFKFKYNNKSSDIIFNHSGFCDKNINDRIVELARWMDLYCDECSRVEDFKRILLKIVNFNIASPVPDLYIVLKNPVVHKEDNVYIVSFDQVVKNYNNEDLIRKAHQGECIIVDNIDELSNDILNRAIEI